MLHFAQVVLVVLVLSCISYIPEDDDMDYDAILSQQLNEQNNEDYDATSDIPPDDIKAQNYAKSAKKFVQFSKEFILRLFFVLALTYVAYSTQTHTNYLQRRQVSTIFKEATQFTRKVCHNVYLISKLCV